MSSFDELLADIRARDQNNDGKLFEVFCKWFLENDPEWSKIVHKVWLWADYPNKWQRQDLGTDLVFEDTDGRVWAVQAKCYAEHRTTTKGDMNSFLADSSREVVSRRLWLQTTNRMEQKAEKTLKGQDKPVTVFKLNDFRNSNLEYPSSFSDIHTAKPKAKPKPDAHQDEAIKAVVDGLKKSDRGQMIMACGTGKTFTTLWIKEAMDAQTTLVLLPSLNLLSQTMHEWSWGSNSDFDILNVCSDKSVGKTSEDMTAAEAPFPVTSEPEEIAAFLKKPSRKVLFCTYQSSPLIAEVQQDKSLPTFDLAIADEAHRCAGKADASFSTILDASKIRSNKRLFTTATPRYFGKNVRDAAKLRDQEIVGMDDEDVFGPVIHTLTFGEAIQRELLNDYQVVVVGVDEPRVKALIENKEIISTDPEKNTDARTLAAKIGLIKAIKDYDLKRVISFHSRVKGAREFSEEFEDVVGLIKSDERPQGVFLSDFVSGEMKTGDRLDKIQQLKSLDAYDRGVICNARCLAEGVDVPSLDGIAFIDPKGSQIEIIQAVGRAIRKVRGAKVQTSGTIVIPVFIEKGDNVEASIEASNFKPVWDVLNALRAHDETLGETLDQYRAALGRGKSDFAQRLEKVVFDLPVSVEPNFAAALQTLVVEACTSSWEYWFAQVEKYLITHAKVPQIPNKKRRRTSAFLLADWCAQQRTLHNKSQLSHSRLVRLENLPGWSWDPVSDRLIENARALHAWCTANDTWLVPDRRTMFDGVNVSSTAKGMRKSKALGTILPEVNEILESIPGWTWDGLEERIWDLKFESYKSWHLQNNRHQPPRNLIVNDVAGIPPFNLGSWLMQQVSRFNAKPGTKRLSEVQIERFETEINFWRWTPWERSFEGYRYAIKKLGSDKLNTHTSIKELPLEIQNVGRWLSKQRQHCKAMDFHSSSKLSPTFLMQLENFGFECDPFALRWHEGFMALLEHVRRNNTARVRQDFLTPEGFPLGSWVSTQRQHCRDVSELKSDEKLRRRLLSELPDWNANWADFRTVNYKAAENEHLRLLYDASNEKPQIRNIILLALYGGMRLKEMQDFKHITIGGGCYLEIGPTAGTSDYRLIPTHPKILGIEPMKNKNYGALAKSFNDAKPDALGKEVHVTSLMLRFLDELKRNGLSGDTQFMIANGSKRQNWTPSILAEIASSINNISYLVFD